MFGFGKRKRKEAAPVKIAPPKECEHKYIDFPWYLEVSTERDMQYYGDRYKCSISIIEPYVCIFCKHRKDVVLDKYFAKGLTANEYNAKLNAIQQTFGDHLRNRAVVEDMINDMQLVDREYLKYYKMVKGMESVPEPKLDLDIFTPKEE